MHIPQVVPAMLTTMMVVVGQLWMVAMVCYSCGRLMMLRVLHFDCLQLCLQKTQAYQRHYPSSQHQQVLTPSSWICLHLQRCDSANS